MLALGVALSVGFAACSDDNDDDNTGGGEIVNPTPGEVPPFTTNLNAEGLYRGDYNDSGCGNILVGISDNTIVYDEDTNQYAGDGKMIAISFYTLLAEDPDFPVLVQGKYTGSATCAKGTFNIGSESYITTYRNGVPTQSSITKGTVTVTTYGDDVYAIDGTVFAGNLPTEVHYVGKIPMYNRSFLGQMSNLTSNVQLTGIKNAAMIDYGNYYSDASDYIMVGLCDDNYTLLENYGGGQCIWLGLNVTVGAAGIPSGTYTLLNSAEMDEDDDFMPFSALDGFYYPPLNGFYGSWFFNSDNGVEAAVKSGTVTVTNKGSNKYSFVINTKDGHGNTITGTFEGTVVYIDAKM